MVEEEPFKKTTTVVEKKKIGSTSKRTLLKIIEKLDSSSDDEQLADALYPERNRPRKRVKDGKVVEEIPVNAIGDTAIAVIPESKHDADDESSDADDAESPERMQWFSACRAEMQTYLRREHHRDKKRLREEDSDADEMNIAQCELIRTADDERNAKTQSQTADPRLKGFPDTGAVQSAIAMPTSCCYYRNARRVPPVRISLANKKTIICDRKISFSVQVRSIDVCADPATIIGDAWVLPHRQGKAHQLCIGRNDIDANHLAADGTHAWVKDSNQKWLLDTHWNLDCSCSASPGKKKHNCKDHKQAAQLGGLDAPEEDCLETTDDEASHPPAVDVTAAIREDDVSLQERVKHLESRVEKIEQLLTGEINNETIKICAVDNIESPKKAKSCDWTVAPPESADTEPQCQDLQDLIVFSRCKKTGRISFQLNGDAQSYKKPAPRAPPIWYEMLEQIRADKTACWDESDLRDEEARKLADQNNEEYKPPPRWTDAELRAHPDIYQNHSLPQIWYTAAVMEGRTKECCFRRSRRKLQRNGIPMVGKFGFRADVTNEQIRERCTAPPAPVPPAIFEDVISKLDDEKTSGTFAELPRHVHPISRIRLVAIPKIENNKIIPGKIRFIMNMKPLNSMARKLHRAPDIKTFETNVGEARPWGELLEIRRQAALAKGISMSPRRLAMHPHPMRETLQCIPSKQSTTCRVEDRCPDQAPRQC